MAAALEKSPVPDGPTTDEVVDDVELALRMMEGDEDALHFVIRRYGPRVLGALRAKFGGTVEEDILEDAVHRAAFTVWRKADRYDDSKASLGGFFYACAWREVINILREGERATLVSQEALDEDLPDRQAAIVDIEQIEELSPDKQKRNEDLLEIIESLPGNQRAIMKADLAAGCNADNAYLAKVLGSSKNSVYVSRNKAHEKIRQEMRKRGHFK
jgi:RNA polymerase sigma-70 factor, ECF subfamily